MTTCSAPASLLSVQAGALEYRQDASPSEVAGAASVIREARTSTGGPARGDRCCAPRSASYAAHAGRLADLTASPPGRHAGGAALRGQLRHPADRLGRTAYRSSRRDSPMPQARAGRRVNVCCRGGRRGLTWSWPTRCRRARCAAGRRPRASSGWPGVPCSPRPPAGSGRVRRVALWAGYRAGMSEPGASHRQVVTRTTTRCCAPGLDHDAGRRRRAADRRRGADRTKVLPLVRQHRRTCAEDIRMPIHDGLARHRATAGPAGTPRGDHADHVRRTSTCCAHCGRGGGSCSRTPTGGHRGRVCRVARGQPVLSPSSPGG